MKSSSLLLGALLVALNATPGRAEPPEKEQERLLDLGARLGDERLEILSFPASGTLYRLKLDPFEKDRTATGRFDTYNVLDSVTLSETQVKELGRMLLDTDVYVGLSIRRPVPPSPIGHGATKLCGGFRPVVGLRLKDVENRTLDVLFCFSCDEVVFEAVDRLEGKREPARKTGSWLSLRGSIRLLERFAQAFPDEEVLSSTRDDHRKKAERLDATKAR